MPVLGQRVGVGDVQKVPHPQAIRGDPMQLGARCRPRSKLWGDPKLGPNLGRMRLPTPDLGICALPLGPGNLFLKWPTLALHPHRMSIKISTGRAEQGNLSRKGGQPTPARQRRVNTMSETWTVSDRSADAIRVIGVWLHVSSEKSAKLAMRLFWLAHGVAEWGQIGPVAWQPAKARHMRARALGPHSSNALSAAN